MNKKQKKNLIRIIISAVLLIAFHFIPKAVLPEKSIVRFIIYLIPYLVVGYDVLIKAFKGIKNKQAFDEYLLMAIATIGAMALGLFKTGDYVEAVAVMLFYQIGEWFQSYAVGKSRRNISDLMDIRPDYANIENEDGSLEQVDPDEVEVGSIIVVQPGEKIPIDGIIVDGNATLNTAALTGESKPRDVEKGDSVISGCINTNGLLKIETTTDFDESTASKILDLVENASSRKSKSEAFISRFARIYTPVVVYLAIALATIPPIVRLIIGMDAIWLPEEKRSEAENAGYVIVDPPTIISTHITEIIKNHAAELLDRQAVSVILDTVKQKNPVLVSEVLDTAKISYGTIEKVLQNLLEEKVSIRNYVRILETMANYAGVSKNVWDLTQKVREALGLQICMQYADDNKKLHVMRLSQELSELVAEHAYYPEDGSKPYVALDPVDRRRWVKAVSASLAKVNQMNYQPIIITVSGVRQLVRSTIEREMPGVVVIADTELYAAAGSISPEIIDEIADENE